jgi:glutamate-1-semialdehyde aminotransferase
MKFCESRQLQKVGHSIIPGGAHTYAKGDDQYPEGAPIFITRGKSCHVWDADGNEFIEYGMGLSVFKPCPRHCRHSETKAVHFKGRTMDNV